MYNNELNLAEIYMDLFISNKREKVMISNSAVAGAQRCSWQLTLASISATFSGVAKAWSRKGRSVAEIAPADPPSDTALFRLDEWATLTAVTCQSSDRKGAGISKPLQSNLDQSEPLAVTELSSGLNPRHHSSL